MSTIVVVGDAGVDVVTRHAGSIVHGDNTRAGISLITGGAGANTAAWLAYAGASPVLVARVGKDVAGRQAHEDLTAAGVRCEFTVDPEVSTCCVVVLVDETGQRSMLPDRGAGRRLDDADLDPALLAEADHLHLSGYVLHDESSRDAGLAMLAAARDAGLSTSVDPQSAALITDRGAFLEWVTGIDLLLPNLDELEALTGIRDPASAVELTGIVGAVAVTTGPKGASWVDAGEVTSVPAADGHCTDSTGAGDAFNAGLITAWLKGMSTMDALRSGVHLGALAVGTVGAQPPQEHTT